MSPRAAVWGQIAVQAHRILVRCWLWFSKFTYSDEWKRIPVHIGLIHKSLKMSLTLSERAFINVWNNFLTVQAAEGLYLSLTTCFIAFLG